MVEPDLTDCITTQELASLFDQAFAKLHGGFADERGLRKTPRVPVQNAGPLFVESYTPCAVKLNCHARITDISAEGLGIILPEEVPVGATLRTILDNGQGERGFGIATVVFSGRCEGGYRVGLRFNEDHEALDEPVAARPARHRWPAAVRLKQACAIAIRKMKRSPGSFRRVERCVNGTHAELIVNAGMFHYAASLRINGRKVAHRWAVLHTRFRNFFRDHDQPTTVVLTARGCSGRALLYAHGVGECAIDLPPS